MLLLLCKIYRVTYHIFSKVVKQHPSRGTSMLPSFLRRVVQTVLCKAFSVLTYIGKLWRVCISPLCI